MTATCGGQSEEIGFPELLKCPGFGGWGMGGEPQSALVSNSMGWGAKGRGDEHM